MSILGVLRLFYWINRHKQIVLTYHNIIPDFLFDDSAHLGVSHCASIFENHIQLIKRKFKKNTCLITFDDGYKNQYEIASKILERYGLNGIFFITFKLIDAGHALTIDKMLQWISYVPLGHYHVFDVELEITEDNREHIASKLYKKLLLNDTLWDKIENELNNVYSFECLMINTELKKLRFSAMSEFDLSLLIKNGHVVAAHGWDHKPLSSLPLEMQQNDFRLSKEFSNKWCNTDLYSYPYGTQLEVSPVTIQLCEQFGFSAAYMNTQCALSFPEENAHYQLPRLNLPNSMNRYLLNAKLSGFELVIKKWFKRL